MVVYACGILWYSIVYHIVLWYTVHDIYGIRLRDGEDDGERYDAPVHVRGEVLAVEPGVGGVG